ncbi:ABC transporter substrate-binding protein [Bradyrhizobium sp. TZ2]
MTERKWDISKHVAFAAFMGASALTMMSQPGLAQSADKQAQLIIGWGSTVDSLNPAITTIRDVGPILANIFDTLVWLTPDFKLTPSLATNWDVSEDGKTYTFKLRKDVTFHDGTPFNAAAVVANFEYIIDKDTQAKNLAQLGPCTSAKALDEYIVQLSCAEPYAPLLRVLGTPYYGIQSPTALKKYGKEAGGHPTGTGPFVFSSYKPNESVLLNRNEKYNWNPPALKHSGPPNIASVTFQIVPNSQARVSQFLAGQSQMIQKTPGIYWSSWKNDSKYTQIPVPVSGMGIFALFNTKRFPTDDIAVRRAIQYAVDKKAVLQLAESGAYPISNTPLQEGMIGYDPSLESSYPFDPQKAAALLTEAGWKKPGQFWERDGKTLTLKMTVLSTRPSYQMISQAMQGYLRQAGMDVQIEQLALSAWFAASIAGNFSLTPLQYVAPDPVGLNSFFLPDQYYAWSKFSDPELTDLLRRGQREADEEKRAQIYKKAQKIIMDNAVMIPIHQNNDLVVVSKNLKGVTYMGGGFEYLGAASLTR